MADEKEDLRVISKLSPVEKDILPYLNLGSVSKISEKSKIDESSIRRALQFLENKNLVETKPKEKKVVVLGENGKLYIKRGLPEKRLLKVVFDSKKISINDAKDKSGLSNEEFTIAFGTLKKKSLVDVDKGIIASKAKKEDVEKKTIEEALLDSLPRDLDGIKDNMLDVYKQLINRKQIVEIKEEKDVEFILTKKGNEILKDINKIKKMNFVEELTPEMIKTNGWRGKKFRHYDIQSKVPAVYGGKKQPYAEFLDDVRKRFMALGFSEMTGTIVESDFWDMDALFMPQFHSARDIHQAYYVKEPKYGKLDESIVKKVKEAHEKGIAGSKGWRYKFDEKKTHRLMLRTQGTALSARQLASKDLKIPGKYFGIARCFRYDVIDATHLPDFNQIEGIVVAPNLTFRHLKSLLKMFAKEFAGTEEIKIVPAYFPFTEPSCELHAKHPQLGWIELGGAGIFRPEVCKSLGVNVPVIAWGLGIDRIAMVNLKIADIRQLFSHDLKYLRSTQ